MDRQIVYPKSQPRAEDFLNLNKDVAQALGMVARVLAGKSSIQIGFDCTPTVPASMAVNLDSGALTKYGAIDSSPYGVLGSDASETQKIGVKNVPTVIPVTPPANPGQTIAYLIQAAYQEFDGEAELLPYMNSDPNNPAPFYGPNDNGQQQNTRRFQTVAVNAKAGVAANTGTEQIPTPDVGYTPMWVVRVSYGQTTITASNIKRHDDAPLPPDLNSRGYPHSKIWETSTTWTYTGANPVEAMVRVQGAGGGGGGAWLNGAGGGGGAGGYAEGVITLTPGMTYTITVGTGGIAGTNTTNGGSASINPPVLANYGGNGGASSFHSYISASGGGGGGGAGQYCSAPGGSGGTSSFAPGYSGPTRDGGWGDNGYIPSASGAGGGRGGIGGSAHLGGGGRNGIGVIWADGGTPRPGGKFGGGGGGAGSGTLGAAGAAGVVEIYY